jgi:hypothetical protein
MKYVFFIGAGFSAVYDMPVMNNFFEKARDTKILEQKEINFLNSLLREARSANSFMQSSPTNLEDILSFAIMSERLNDENISKTNQNISKSEKIKKIIQKVYSHIPKKETYLDNIKSLSEFCGFSDFDNHGNQISFITTNYDLFIELMLMKDRLKTNPICEFNNIELTNYYKIADLYNKKTGKKVMKLHGSVNWFSNDNEDDSIDVVDNIVKYNPWRNSKLNTHIPAISDRPKEIIDRSPIIIPPSYLKPKDNPLDKIWVEASKTLKEADQIFFIGYSFPQTDTEMRYFLASSLVSNYDLTRIYIIDINAENIVKKITNDENGYGYHFKKLLFYYEGTWESKTIQDIIDNKSGDVKKNIIA